ncbi:MAG: hypothetical protein ABMA01_14815, partial [Chthoniobacteraceae bacterium]
MNEPGAVFHVHQRIAQAERAEFLHDFVEARELPAGEINGLIGRRQMRGDAGDPHAGQSHDPARGLHRLGLPDSQPAHPGVDREMHAHRLAGREAVCVH